MDHQLVRKRGGKYYVKDTRTTCGCRFLQMTDTVYHSLKKMLERRPKVKKEVVVDGYTGFIMLDKNDNPKVALHIENEMRWAMKKYKKLHPDSPLPHITPHVFRHTFCTNYANDGMDIKNLQYLMGHSGAGVTLSVDAHASYAHAAEQVAKILPERGSGWLSLTTPFTTPISGVVTWIYGDLRKNEEKWLADFLHYTIGVLFTHRQKPL